LGHMKHWHATTALGKMCRCTVQIELFMQISGK
jgi:hypothetical protein